MKKLLKLLTLWVLIIVPLSTWAQCPNGSTECTITVLCGDAMGDGWNGAKILVYQDTTLRGEVTFTGGYEAEVDVAVCSGQQMRFVWQSGLYDYETSITIYNGDGSTILYGACGGDYSNGTTMATAMPACAGCPKPTGLVCHADSTDATLSWNANGANTWLVYLGGVYHGTTNTPGYTFTNLVPGVSYDVRLRALCGSDTSQTLQASFRTLCNAMHLPYRNTFDTELSGYAPECWNPVVTMGDYPMVNSIEAYSDSLSLHFSAGNGYNIIATPLIMVPGDEIIVSFKARLSQGISHGDFHLTNAWIQGGIMTDLSDTSTFIPLINVNLQDNVWREYDFNTIGLDSSTGYFVAFKYFGSDALFCNGQIDDLAITHDNGCYRPETLYVDSVGARSAWLRWTGAGTNTTEYEILYSTENNPLTATSSIIVTDTTAELDLLSQSTTYFAWVRTICDQVSADLKAFPPFTTTMTCAPVTDVTLSNVSLDAAMLTWQYDLLNGGAPVGAIVRLYPMGLIGSGQPVAQATTSDNMATLTGLEPGTGYTALVQTLCQLADDESDTANAVRFNFMTLPCHEQAGNGNTYDDMYAVSTSMTHSYTQSLYTGADLPRQDTIRGIAWRAADAINDPLLLDLYMGNTSLTTISTSQYVPYSDLRLVAANHTIEPQPGGWHIIAFDSVFVTDTANLVVAALNKSGHFFIDPLYWTYQSTTQYATAVWNSYTPVSPANPQSYWLNNLMGVADIRFLTHCDIPECHAPMVSHYVADSTSIEFSWLGNDNVYEYVVQYRQAGQPQYQQGGTVGDTATTLYNLSPATRYQLRVGAICNDDTVWGYFNVTTDCGAVQVPYMEDFDGYSGSGVPQCWLGNSSTLSHDLGGLIWLSNSNGIPAMLPLFEEDITNLEINFKAMLHDSDNIMIGVADPDGSNLQWIDTLHENGQSYSTYTWYRYSFENYSGNGQRIALSHTAGDDFMMLADDVSVSQASGCLPAQDITATGADNASSIVITWTGNAAATTWRIAWDTVGTPLAAAQHTATTSTNSYAMPPLVSGGKYIVYVAAQCGSDSSIWRSQVFAAGAVIMHANSVDTVSGCGLVIYDDGGMAGNYSDNSSSTLIIRPDDPNKAVSISGGIIELTAWPGDELSIYEGEGTSGSLLFHTDWTYGSIMLGNAITSEEGPMTIVFNTNWSGNAMGFELFATCIDMPSCRRPRNVTVNGTTPTTADLSWTATADAYSVYYRQQGNDSWQATSASGTSVTLTGLSSGTTYEVEIQAFCGSEQSARSVTLTFTTDCLATTIAPGMAIDESFESAEAPATCFTMLSTNSENAMVHSADRAFDGQRSFRFSSYQNATDFNQYLISPLLDTHDSITMTFRYSDAMYGNELLRVGYSFTGNNPDDFYWTDSLRTMGVQWLSYGRDFPAGVKYLAINYCSDYRYYAYVDSLHIGVVASAECNHPTITQVTEGMLSVSVDFQASGTVEAYITQGAWNDNVSGVMTTGSSHTFANLEPGTNYTIGLRSRCANGSISNWVTREVTTAVLNCTAPTDFAIGQVGYTTADFSWSGDASAYEINIFNTAEDLSYTTTGSPFTVNGLHADLPYKARIRSVCGNYVSEWSETVIEFQTAYCDEPSGLTLVEATATGNVGRATIQWQGSAEAYEVNYGHTRFMSGQGVVVRGISGTSITIDSLELNEDYDIYVRSICDSTTSSIWSHVLTFRISSEGIEEAAGTSIAIHPNPASGATTVTIDNVNDNLTVDVIDLNGRVVRHTEGIVCYGGCRHTVNLANLPAGTYFVRVSGEHTNITSRLVVQ